MRTTTCIIDTYNHERYVSEAVDSALRQTVAFDEIIVVDDASTDQSRVQLDQHYSREPRVKLIFRESNGGQLACLQTGFSAATGDVCCFLDGDDRLAPEYLRYVKQHFEETPSSQAAYVSCKAFDQSIRRIFRGSGTQRGGCCVGLTLRGNALIGAPTSCLSFRSELLSRALPYPFLDDWVIRADDYLNAVSSLLGARKTLIDNDLVYFRWHDRNNSWTIGQRLATYRRRLSLNRLRKFYADRLSLDPKALESELHREFVTWNHPSWKLFTWYLRTTIGGQQPLLRKVSQAASMLHHQIKSLFTPEEAEVESLQYCKLLQAMDLESRCTNDDE